MNKSLLVLGRGDSPETDKNRARLVKYALEAGFEVQTADYHELEQLRQFKNETLNIMPFFPYTFWNKNCEIPDDTGLYGTSQRAYHLFRDLLLNVQGQLELKFSGHKAMFAAHLKYAAADRDKLQAIQILNAHGVSTPEMLTYGNLSDILSQATPEKGVFIKCRYGAEGKGITFIKPGRWVTNYKVEGRRLANYGVYDIWDFTDITGKKELLEQLIEQEVIVEREIVPKNIFEGKKSDFRVYVVGSETPHFSVRINDFEKVITNWSQGGRIIHHPETGLAEELMRSIGQEAKKAAEAFHSRLMGIDVMLDQESASPKVIELQAFTGFPDIRKFNLGRYLVNSSFFY